MRLLPRTASATALSALVGLTAAGCGGSGTTPPPAGADPRTGAAGAAGTTGPGGSADATGPAGSPPPQQARRSVDITVGGLRLTATLADTPAAADLIAQLPLTVDMTDHDGVEKTGPLPAPLSLAGRPEGADPAAGDLGYYAPGNDLVLYYGDRGYFPGIVVLGRLDGTAAQRISALAGPVTVVVEVSGE